MVIFIQIELMQLSRASSRRHSITSTPGPSVQLQDILEKLGRVHVLHEALEKRVEEIEVTMITQFVIINCLLK